METKSPPLFLPSDGLENYYVIKVDAAALYPRPPRGDYFIKFSAKTLRSTKVIRCVFA